MAPMLPMQWAPLGLTAHWDLSAGPGDHRQIEHWSYLSWEQPGGTSPPMQLPHLLRGWMALTQALRLPRQCSSYSFHTPSELPLFCPARPVPQVLPSPPSEETVVMRSPGDLCDTDNAHSSLRISPCCLCHSLQGHPQSFYPDHVQVVFRKILSSPRWEPGSAEGWGGWEGGVWKGFPLCTGLSSALCGMLGGQWGECFLSTERQRAEALPRQDEVRAALGRLIPCDLRRWQRGWPCELQEKQPQ